jgi:hypothetical protein
MTSPVTGCWYRYTRVPPGDMSGAGIGIGNVGAASGSGERGGDAGAFLSFAPSSGAFLSPAPSAVEGPATGSAASAKRGEGPPAVVAASYEGGWSACCVERA